MRSRAWFPTLIIAIFLVLLISGSLELSTDAMIFPWAIGGCGFILLAWQIMREVREARRGTQEGVSLKQLGAYLPGIAWLLAILPMIYLLGFLVTIPLYVFLYLKFHGEKWPLCLILTSVVGAFFYFAFVVALKVPFYEGLLFLYIMG